MSMIFTKTTESPESDSLLRLSFTGVYIQLLWNRSASFKICTQETRSFCSKRSTGDSVVRGEEADNKEMTGENPSSTARLYSNDRNCYNSRRRLTRVLLSVTSGTNGTPQLQILAVTKLLVRLIHTGGISGCVETTQLVFWSCD